MKMFLLSTIFVSSTYIYSSHPVILMVLILAQTMNTCLMVWVSLKISWFSYILFLIFLGGLMVLFIYITSLASNELMQFASINLMFFVAITTYFMVMNFNSLPLAEDSTTLFVTKTFNIMYSWNDMGLLVTTMIYLLLTLIIVVKVSNKFNAPLKNLIFK